MDIQVYRLEDVVGETFPEIQHESYYVSVDGKVWSAISSSKDTTVLDMTNGSWERT